MMDANLQQLPTFSLWAGVEVAHPVARALGAVPAECYDTDSTSSSAYISVWCELADRPEHDIEAGHVVGLFMPPELIGTRTAPPAMLRAHVVHIGPKPGHQRVPGEPTPHLLHLDVERW